MVLKEFDLVVFGATGYTGKFVVRELIQQIKSSSIGSFAWAIAGRSKEKLTTTLKQVAQELDVSHIDVPTIEADVKNEASIKSMCERTRLVINCVGPYRFYGEQVVKQCIESGTHHLDVSGEPEFLENMQLKYGQLAAQNGVCVVGSCGFDSVPADIGFLFTKKNFKNDLNHVESFLTIELENAPATFNYATWESAVYGFSSAKNLARIRKQLFPNRMPRPSYHVPKRDTTTRLRLAQSIKTNMLGFFYDETLKKYCFPFMGSDKSVVQRTQYFLWEKNNEKAAQYLPYFTIDSLFHVFLIILWALSFSFLANFKIGRHLLLKYHNIFSFGYATKKETSYAQMVNSRFKMQFRGCGFDRKLDAGDTKAVEKPNKHIITEITGPAKIVLACGMILLEKDEKSKLPLKGGVFTPGAAFFDTNSEKSSDLIERLSKSGLEFKVLRNDSS